MNYKNLEYIITILLPLHLIFFLGMFVVDYSILYVGLALISWVIIDGYGIELYSHRILSHAVLSPPRIITRLLAIISCYGGQWSPLWWMSLHRNHHKHSDQFEDIHSPISHGWFSSFLGWYVSPNRSNIKLDRKLIKDKFHKAIHRHYKYIYWLPIICLGIIDINIAFYMFIIPAIMSIYRVNTVNVLCHDDNFGVQSYNTGDHSRDIKILSFFTWGLSLHNTHHKYPIALFYDKAVGFDFMRILLGRFN